MTKFLANHAWIACQLGAREHYSIPCALHQAGLLRTLVTDVWLRPGPQQAFFPVRRWRDRTASGLPASIVRSFNTGAIAFEARHRLGGLREWELILARNEWFEDRVLHELSRGLGRSSELQTLFSYSYTARRPFRIAKERGWRCVLGQIDPGPVEERIVAQLQDDDRGHRGNWQPAPADYWDRWREECDLADCIIANSDWSRRALIEEGIPGEKIVILPLAYALPAEALGFQRSYPERFSSNRPMRVLFLGQANVRKGMTVLVDVMRRMSNAEVEFWIVGDVSVPVPSEVTGQSNIRWHGSVPRSQAQSYYQQADVFVLPTFSDGFAITQLEAQAWKLPVIASRFCGEVVRDGENGVLLSEVSADAVEAALYRLLRNPNELAGMSIRSGLDERFGLSSLSSSLEALGMVAAC